MDGIGEPDISAFGEVLSDLAEEEPTMQLGRAVEVKGWLDALAGTLGKTIDLVKARIQTLAKEPVVYAGKVYSEKPKGTWRPDHTALRRQIIQRSVVNADGEVVSDPLEAATRAVALTFDCFVSPSSMPKTGALDNMGLAKNDVGEWKRTGAFELKVTDLDVEVDDA